ncbi:MAG: flavin reductase [Bacteroidetes bacterium]|nr:flavin reductase [Bacteroidota bacterium]
MINYDALFKISYGLYIVCSGNKDHGNGFISNTVFQVTAEPVKFAACCSKKNYTAEVIRETGAFSVSVLHTEASPDLFGRFGYKSGKDFNKLGGLRIRYGENTGVPVVLNDTIAILECRLVQTVDVGTHFIFIGELLHSEILDDAGEPITYSHYRRVRKGAAPENAPTYVDKSKLNPVEKRSDHKKYECLACGYIYDEAIEGIKFSNLPSDWVCPSCGVGKENFMEIKE